MRSVKWNEPITEIRFENFPNTFFFIAWRVHLTVGGSDSSQILNFSEFSEPHRVWKVVHSIKTKFAIFHFTISQSMRLPRYFIVLHHHAKWRFFNPLKSKNGLRKTTDENIYLFPSKALSSPPTGIGHNMENVWKGDHEVVSIHFPIFSAFFFQIHNVIDPKGFEIRN